MLFTGLVAAALLVVAPAAGGVAGLIDASALPDDPAVRRAWADAAAYEPVAGSWQQDWRHSIPKETVAKDLAASLSTLRSAATRDDRTELLLALGLAARFAHNLDVEGAADVGFQALRKAMDRPGDDPRPAWFLAGSLCSTGLRPEAMALLQAAEVRAGKRPLPVDYWRDVLFCASSLVMPAHALRAGGELDRLGASQGQVRKFVENAEGLLRESDPSAEIARADSWRATETGGDFTVTSLPCGFSVTGHRLREWNAYAVKNGICAVTGPIGPYVGKTGNVTPHILAIGHVPGKGGTLEGFVSRFLPGAKRTEVEGLRCPAESCSVFEVYNPDSYTPEGGGFVLAVAFERPEPPYRGLALERPATPEVRPDGKVQYFRPQPRQVRFRGRVFYLVMLDSARSVADPARAEYRRFLERLVVE